MIKWLKRRAYLNGTTGIVQAMTLLFGEQGKMLTKHAGVKQAILMNFDQGISEPVAATHVAATLMADAIERDDDTIRKQIVTQLLDDWSVTENPRSIRRQLREGTLDQDLLLTRLQWVLLIGQDMLADGEIEKHDFVILKDEIYGALREEPRGQRTINRLNLALDDILGKQA